MFRTILLLLSCTPAVPSFKYLQSIQKMHARLRDFIKLVGQRASLPPMRAPRLLNHAHAASFVRESGRDNAKQFPSLSFYHLSYFKTTYHSIIRTYVRAWCTVVYCEHVDILTGTSLDDSQHIILVSKRPTRFKHGEHRRVSSLCVLTELRDQRPP